MPVLKVHLSQTIHFHQEQSKFLIAFFLCFTAFLFILKYVTALD